MIDYTCPKCKTPMSSPESMICQSEKCPECGMLVQVVSDELTSKAKIKKTFVKNTHCYEFKIKVCKAHINNIKARLNGQGKMILYMDSFGNKMVHANFKSSLNYFILIIFFGLFIGTYNIIGHSLLKSGVITWFVQPWIILIVVYFCFRYFFIREYEFVSKITKDTCVIAPNNKICFLKMNDENNWMAIRSNEERSQIISLYIS